MYTDIRCEVQIKTMLHDGWTAKTHDLTYKPGGEVDDRLDKHVGVLGDVLQLLDDQSELIKDLIIEKWNMDKGRRAAVRLALLVNLTEDDKNLPYYKEIVSLVKRIERTSNHLKYARDTDEEYRELMDSVRRIVTNHGHSHAVCRLIALLACVRESGDLNRYALNEVNKWKRSTKRSPTEHGNALLFYALANYLFGDFIEAVKAGEQTLKYCVKKVPPLVTGAKQTLSYLIAEAYYHHRNTLGVTSAAKARQLIDEVMQGYKGAKPPSYLDTKGFIEIACGETEAEVKKGLSLCQQALNKINKTDKSRRSIAKAFCWLHKRRAYRRLLEWE